MMNPKNWLRHYNEGEEIIDDFILPHGSRQKDKFSDTIYHIGIEVLYHCRRHGFETFEVARCSVDCVVDGRHFIAQVDVLVHLPPDTAYGFALLEKGTIWRELLQEMDLSGRIFEKNMVNAYYAPLKEMLRSWKCIVQIRYCAGKSLRPGNSRWSITARFSCAVRWILLGSI